MMIKNKSYACIGKHYSSKEFLHLGLKDRLFIECDQWIARWHKKNLQLTTNDDHLSLTNAAYNFIMPSEMNMVIGRLTPSQDAMGRCYPLLTYKEVSNALMQEFPEATPYLYKNNYQTIEKFQTQAVMNFQVAMKKIAGERSPTVTRLQLLEKIVHELKNTFVILDEINKPSLIRSRLTTHFLNVQTSLEKHKQAMVFISLKKIAQQAQLLFWLHLFFQKIQTNYYCFVFWSEKKDGILKLFFQTKIRPLPELSVIFNEPVEKEQLVTINDVMIELAVNPPRTSECLNLLTLLEWNINPKAS